MNTIIGIDVGGTNISAVIADKRGKVIYKYTRKSDYYGSNYIKNIEEIIYELTKMSKSKILGIGIGVPGTVDNIRGEVLACPALNWKNFKLKDYIENKFNIKTFIENDVNAWTISEKYLGVSKDSTNFVMITIGTGIGCGLYLDGKIYRGHTFEAGEIGYLPVGMEAYEHKCSYNDFGYFESNASASATSKLYYDLTKRNSGCKEIFTKAVNGENEALIITDHVYKYLGLGISTIICILNPELIIIGGGMAQEGELFLNNIIKNVSQLTPINTKICLTSVGSYGGAIGSALSAFLSI